MISRWLMVSILCVAITRPLQAQDSVVVFNELMYNNASGDALEWIEFYNQMAVDVELSGWRITGADFTFPPGTIIPARSYLVVASDAADLKNRAGVTNILGPLTSNLANGGERLRLRNHNDRVMDQVRYSDDAPWPVGADGSGFTLAKAHVNRASDDDRSWRVSQQRGGTPGRENFTQSPPPIAPVLLNEISSATTAPFWIELLNTGTTTVSLTGAALESAGDTDATYAFPGNTTIPPGEFLLLDQLTLGFRPAAGDRLFLYASEGDALLDATVVRDTARARSAAHEQRWLVPSEPTPDGENIFAIENSVVISEIMYHPRDLPPIAAIYEDQELVPMDATWRYEQTGNPVLPDWMQPSFTDTSWPSGAALLYVENSSLPAPKNTELQLGRLSYFFRTEFEFDGSLEGAELYLEHIIDDGAVFYLNGEEILRVNMPAGPVSQDTLAASGIGEATLGGPVTIPALHLLPGRNVLAVQVHQTSAGSSDIVFGARLGARKLVSPPRDFAESNNQWVELFNKGTAEVNLTGWSIGDATRYFFPEGTVIAPGDFLVVAKDTNSFAAEWPEVPALGNFEFNLSRGSDLLTLEDALGNPADELRYYDDRPWPWVADGSGASLELRDVHADNRRPEAWAASVRHGEWQNYSYTGVAQNDNGPTRWNEFIFGLLDAGEILVDDFSVIENPDSGSQRELLQNGSFEASAASWRFLGTHRQATVVDDPEEPGNKVLHLIADGSTEHMHNHVETTYAGNSAIANGRTYQISFRAKWLAGCNKLNTRLYFNRVARTTDLALPVQFGTPGARNSTWIENSGPTFTGLAHSPIVPRNSTTVTISVEASDPDGIESIRLWSAANGTSWTSTDMALQNGRYTASISPKPSGTVVQFYIEATDNAGATSFYPAEGRESRALYRVADAQGVSSRMHNMRLIMLPADAEELHAPTNVMSNGRSLLTVIYDESDVFYNTSLHLQSSQRGRLSSGRVGFTVRFPADQLFRGVQDSVTLDRSGGYSGRGGPQDEIVLRHILNQAGDLPDMYNDFTRLIAPLSTHTGTAQLLMAKHGSDYFEGIREGMEEGTLLKIELIYSPTTTVNGNPEAPKLPQPDDVTGIDLNNRGDDKEAYRWFYLMENHQERDDYRRLIEMAQAFSLSGTAFEQTIGELIDVSQWARVFAAKSLSGDVDTYAFGLPHNHMFFFPPDEKAITLPWDMDFAWTRGTGDSIYPGAQVAKVFAVPAWRRLFLGHLSDILDRSYNTDYMAYWTGHYGTIAAQNYSGILSYIGQRATAARSQLPAPAQFRILSNAGQGFSTNTTQVRLYGEAPYTLERLEINGQTNVLFTWPDTQSWEAEVTLQPGLNAIELLGHTFAGETIQRTINIDVVLPYQDQDNDGMPDDWETAHGLNPTVNDAAGDADGDGLSNLHEYLAGTHPSDSANNLALNVSETGSGLSLSFQAKAGRAYRVQYRTGLAATWRDVLKIPTRTSNESIQVQQTISPLARSIFYRVILDQ